MLLHGMYEIFITIITHVFVCSDPEIEWLLNASANKFYLNSEYLDLNSGLKFLSLILLLFHVGEHFILLSHTRLSVQILR